MSLLPDLSLLALRPFLSNTLEQAQGLAADVAQQGLSAAPAAAFQVVVKFLVSRFTDPSKKLPDALRRSADRAWRSLEVALAGESWWTRLRDRGEDKAFREQVRLFLDARALDLPKVDEAFRRRCLDQLKAARKAGLIPGDLDPKAAAERAADFTRFGQPTQAREAEWRIVARMAGRLRGAGYAGLADLLELQPPGQDAPLLAVAVRFFFRREIESDASLFHGFLYAQVDHLGESVRAGFERLGEAFAGLGPALEQHGESLEQILGVLSALRGDVLDVKGEMEKQGAGQQVLYREVMRLGEKLDGLHERALRPADSLSIRDDAERQLVKQLVTRYRALPDEQRRRLPALLGAVSRLEMAAGDFPAARADFRQLTHLVSAPGDKAAAHFVAYLAALESRDWDAALLRLTEAVRLDPAHFAPFPDRFEAERILGAGGFGVVFLCRHRLSRARLVVKAIHAEALGRDLASVFEEAAVLEELEHPAVVRLRDCDYADAGRTRPFLVMDYFDGPTLEEHVKRLGALLPADARAVARQMAEGLRVAHGRNLLHRDVKPGNVLVRRASDGWQVKLIDFGLALRRQAARNTVSNADALAKTVRGASIAGTLDYAAPEQMGRLDAPVGTYSDVYGFGRSLCYALFGTPHPLPRQWRGLRDEGLGELLEACIEEQPRNRPSDFDKVLQRLLQGRPPAVPQSTPGEAGVRTSTAATAPRPPAVPQSTPGEAGVRTSTAATAPRPPAVPQSTPGEAGVRTSTAATAPRPPAVPQSTPGEPPADRDVLREIDRLRSIGKESGDYLKTVAAARLDAWRTAAASGSPKAQYLFALCLLFGTGIQADTTEGVRWLRTAAEKGYQRAQNTLGELHLTGRGVVKDYAEALGWFHKAVAQHRAACGANLLLTVVPGYTTEPAVEQDYGASQTFLGMMYANGWGVPQDDAKAVAWYRKAAEQPYALALSIQAASGGNNSSGLSAEQGYALAQSKLGFMYAYGRGVVKDDAEAVRWYRLAAEQGLADAQFNLGLAYENGQGVAQNDAEAVNWYRKAAEQGHADAQTYLGWMYKTGRGVPKDKAAAVLWYRKAAEQGNSLGQYSLGSMYKWGRGVPKDEAAAVLWYRKAAEQGDAQAQVSLGSMLQVGRGAARDDGQALEWYRKAAEQGDAQAQFCVGSMYENGQGVARSCAMALQWYRKAAAQGHEAAKQNMERLTNVGG